MFSLSREVIIIAKTDLFYLFINYITCMWWYFAVKNFIRNNSANIIYFHLVPYQLLSSSFMVSNDRVRPCLIVSSFNFISFTYDKFEFSLIPCKAQSWRWAFFLLLNLLEFSLSLFYCCHHLFYFIFPFAISVVIDVIHFTFQDKILPS